MNHANSSIGFEQFDQGVGEKLLDLVLNVSKVLKKQMKTRETRLQQPQNGVRLNPKPTLRNKKNKTTKKHKKRKHLQK